MKTNSKHPLLGKDFLAFTTFLALFLLSDPQIHAQLPGSFDASNDVANPASPTKTKTQFIRLTKEAGQPKALQTSVTRYMSQDGKLLVDLIGVIHVGDREYYRKLNHQFKLYDSVLYELVAAPENQVPTGQQSRASGNPISWIQNSMQQLLGLESQLSHIDYTRSNFVHADLTPRQLQQAMAKRGDTAWSLGLRALSEMMKNGNKKPAPIGLSELTDVEDLLSLVQHPQKLKIMMATQFASSESLEAGLGDSLNQLLIIDRNQAAMKVLKSEIDKGQKRIGIFYGAAHMPDFENRLETDCGLIKTKQAWVDAWDLTHGKTNEFNPADALLRHLLKMLDE